MMFPLLRCPPAFRRLTASSEHGNFSSALKDLSGALLLISFPSELDLDLSLFFFFP